MEHASKVLYGQDDFVDDPDNFIGAGLGYAILDANGVFTRTYGLNVTTSSIGVNILEVYLPVSPFLVQCDQLPCERESHIANETGYCNCNTANGYVRVPSGCMRVSILVLVGVITLPILVIVFLFVVIIVYSRYKVQHADAVWKIDYADLLFPDPPEVLGRGAFGLVVGAEYRKTNVAIKRMLPVTGTSKNRFSMLDNVGSGVSIAGVAVHSGEYSGSESEGLPMPSASGDESVTERSNTWSHTDMLKRLKSGNAAGSSFKGFPHRSRSNSASSHEVSPQPEENLGTKTVSSISSKMSILKRIMPGYLSEGRAQRASFISEMRLLSRLRHPCITTVMGVVIDRSHEPMLVWRRMDTRTRTHIYTHTRTHTHARARARTHTHISHTHTHIVIGANGTRVAARPSTQSHNGLRRRDCGAYG